MISHIAPEEAQELEKNNQTQSKIWKDIRLHHLTASKFGKICKITDRKNVTAFCKALTTQKQLKTAAILHGQKYEVVAVGSFESKFNTSTKPYGIFVSTIYPQLAATPDRVIDKESIVEVKCPHIAKVNPTILPYLKVFDQSMVLMTIISALIRCRGNFYVQTEQYVILLFTL